MSLFTDQKAKEKLKRLERLLSPKKQQKQVKEISGDQYKKYKEILYPKKNKENQNLSPKQQKNNYERLQNFEIDIKNQKINNQQIINKEKNIEIEQKQENKKFFQQKFDLMQNNVIKKNNQTNFQNTDKDSSFNDQQDQQEKSYFKQQEQQEKSYFKQQEQQEQQQQQEKSYFKQQEQQEKSYFKQLEKQEKQEKSHLKQYDQNEKSFFKQKDQQNIFSKQNDQKLFFKQNDQQNNQPLDREQLEIQRNIKQLQIEQEKLNQDIKKLKDIQINNQKQKLFCCKQKNDDEDNDFNKKWQYLEKQDYIINQQIQKEIKDISYNLDYSFDQESLRQDNSQDYSIKSLNNSFQLYKQSKSNDDKFEQDDYQKKQRVEIRDQFDQDDYQRKQRVETKQDKPFIKVDFDKYSPIKHQDEQFQQNEKQYIDNLSQEIEQLMNKNQSIKQRINQKFGRSPLPEIPEEDYD